MIIIIIIIIIIDSRRRRRKIIVNVAPIRCVIPFPFRSIYKIKNARTSVVFVLDFFSFFLENEKSCLLLRPHYPVWPALSSLIRNGGEKNFSSACRQPLRPCVRFLMQLHVDVNSKFPLHIVAMKRREGEEEEEEEKETVGRNWELKERKKGWMYVISIFRRLVKVISKDEAKADVFCSVLLTGTVFSSKSPFFPVVPSPSPPPPPPPPPAKSYDRIFNRLFAKN